MSLPQKMVALIFALAFVFGLVACQQEGTAEKAGKKIDKAAEQTSEYMDDASVTAKVKAEIMSDPLLKVAQINVTTTNGSVKLTGVVDSQHSVDRALEIARSVKSVKSVENSLVVGSAK